MERAVARSVSRAAAASGLALGAVLAVIALVTALVGTTSVTATITNYMIMVVSVMALAIFSGNSGILSFGHVAFMALGAQISSTLTLAPMQKAMLMPALPAWIAQAQFGFSAALAITIAVVMLVATPTGMVIRKLAAPVVPIATLGLLIIVNSLIIGSDGVTRGSQAMYGVPNDVGLWVATSAAAIATFIASLYRESAAGLSLRASREDEAAASAVGVNVPAQRMIGWIWSGAVAAAAGALLAHYLTVFSPKDFFFDLTFATIVMLIVGGMGSVTGALVGTSLVTVLIEILRRLENGFSIGPIDFPQIFGFTQIGLCVLILAILYRRPGGLLGFVEIGRFLVRPRREASTSSTPPAEGAAEDTLEISRVRKQFGGLTAVDDVTLSLRRGEILGLIGPNGSGKSTLLGCIAGNIAADHGSIRISGREMCGQPAFVIARGGVARNFQSIRLFANLTPLENVKAAALQKHRGMSLVQADAAALKLLAELRIEALADRRSGDLAYGQQRRVEIARALALDPNFLLLDEPAAGMNEAETDELLSILEWLTQRRRLGLLIVDHDMSLIMRLCHRIAVLNKGQLIALGSPSEIRASAQVREAYLGRRHSQILEAAIVPLKQTGRA